MITYLITALDYVYRNEIYYKPSPNAEPQLIFKWKCTYEDKYQVSLDFAIKPVQRTLQFVTEKGKFDVAMKVYQDEQFTPQSEVSSYAFDWSQIRHHQVHETIS